MKIKVSLLLLLVTLFSCKKDKNNTITLNGKLTDCAANNTCTYKYYDNANFTSAGQVQVVPGSFRVFAYQSINSNVCSATREFYFKTSLSNSNIEISSNQIAAGQVQAYDLICPCCNSFILARPIGGEIKGQKTDANHWLINATIIFGTSFNQPTDTMTVNQYFTSAIVP